MKIGKILFAFSFMSTVSACSSNNSDTESLDNRIAHYIQNNPEKIIQSVLDYRDKKRDVSRIEIQSELPNLIKKLMLSKDTLILRKGERFLFEILDYNCGYCKKTPAQLEKLFVNKEQVGLIVIPAPILSKDSELAVMAVYAAQRKGLDYIKMHQYLLALDRVNPDTTRPLMAKFGVTQSDIDQSAYILKKNLAIFESLKASGTPVFFGENGIRSGFDYSKIVDLI